MSIEHTIFSYNMSWASASGFFGDNVPRCSEHEFLKRAKKKFEFWDNALQHLEGFISEKKPTIFGLQEVILPTCKKEERYSKDNRGFNEKWHGTIDHIRSLAFYEGKYHSKVGDVTYINDQNEEITSCVATFWDYELGEKINERCVNLTTDDGRPLSMIHTAKGYILINLHAPHRYTLKDISSEINYHLTSFILDKNIEWVSSRIYITGDFNNIEINNKNPLVLFPGTELEIKMTPGEAAVKSCCFGSGRNLKDYEKVGDYCLGKKIAKRGDLQIDVTQIISESGRSKESDHELVWARFLDNND